MAKMEIPIYIADAFTKEPFGKQKSHFWFWFCINIFLLCSRQSRGRLPPRQGHFRLDEAEDRGRDEPLGDGVRRAKGGKQVTVDTLAQHKIRVQNSSVTPFIKA
jgi:hypothetical protein